MTRYYVLDESRASIYLKSQVVICEDGFPVRGKVVYVGEPQGKTVDVTVHYVSRHDKKMRAVLHPARLEYGSVETYGTPCYILSEVIVLSS